MYLKYPELNNKDWVNIHYIRKEMSMPEIAKLLNCSVGTVQNAIKKYNIKLRTKKEALKLKGINHFGDNNPNWKGGIRKENGYICIYSPWHPYAIKSGYVREHRLVIEKYIGRYLLPREIVHHINGIRNDNRIENLKLIESSGKHFIKEHLDKRDKFGKFIRNEKE